MLFPVSLSIPATQTVTVEYASFNNTASAPTDFGVVLGTLSFAPGETLKNITVTVNGGGNFGSRTFDIRLANPVNATIARGLAVGTISNVQPSPTPTPTPGTCVTPPSGMAAWYPFEGNGNDFYAGNNATLSGTYSFAAAEVNQGLQVTDASGRVPDAAALRPPTAITIDAWVKASSPGTFRYLLNKSDVFSNGGSYSLYTGSSGGLIFYVTVNGNFVLSPDAGPGIWNGQFHHVAGTYDGSRVRLFVDGAEVGSGTAATGAINYATVSENGDLFIGRYYSGSGGNFAGVIDELTLYNRALAAGEIQSIFNANTAGKCKSSARFHSLADFDGDGKTDVSVYRPSDGSWYLSRSTAGFGAIHWGGAPGDTIIPGDYDGDGKADFAISRPSDTPYVTDYYILNSNGFTVNGYAHGLTTDIPVTGDFDGDGKNDIVVFRPSTGVWYLWLTTTQTTTAVPFGQTGDIPFTMDNEGTGKANLAVFRPNNNTWYIAKSTGPPAQNFTAVQFGLSTDILVPGDYDGDGKTDVAVFRPSNGTWYILRSSDNQVKIVQFGAAGDVPVPGDYDGDGKTDLAVCRGGLWYINGTTSGFSAQQFGLSTDKPVPAAYHP